MVPPLRTPSTAPAIGYRGNIATQETAGICKQSRGQHPDPAGRSRSGRTIGPRDRLRPHFRLFSVRTQAPRSPAPAEKPLHQRADATLLMNPTGCSFPNTPARPGKQPAPPGSVASDSTLRWPLSTHFRLNSSRTQLSKNDRSLRERLATRRVAHVAYTHRIPCPRATPRSWCTRHFPDDLQVCGDHTRLPPPRERHPFRSHPMA